MTNFKNFVKEHKGAVIASVIAIVVIIILVIALMGNKEGTSVSTSTDNSVSVSTESSVESSSTEKDYLSGIGVAPEDSTLETSESDKDTITFPNGEDDKSESESSESDKSESEKTESDKSESEKTESDKSESVNSESKEPTSSETKKPESSETKEPESSESKKPESSETKKPESSESKKPESSETKEPEKEPEKPSTPNGPTFSGGNITLGNIGITVPTLNEFNKDGLNKDTFWYSDDNTRQIFADNGNAIMDATGYGVAGSDGNGFTISEYYLDWAYGSYSVVNDISLKRDVDNNYYVLEINTPLDKCESVLEGGRDVAPTSRDILKFMLSCVSSTPETVYNYIYNGLYKDASTLNCTTYQKAGDCKILLDENFQVTDGFHIKFYIKPAK